MADPADLAAERERISVILSLPEAKGRDALARHLAFSTSLSVPEAQAALAAAPAATAAPTPAARSPLGSKSGAGPVGITASVPSTSGEMPDPAAIYASRKADVAKANAKMSGRAA